MKRNPMNRAGFWGAVAVIVGTCAVWAEPQPKPNILLIISDDQGYGDFGFMGNPTLRTPRIDRLAQGGAVFRNFVTGPACSPGRSMFFTGRTDLLTGVWGVPPRQNLRADETMMPAFFDAAGYGTYYLGKSDCVAQHHTLPWFAGWNDAFCGGGYVHHNAVLQRKPAGEKPIIWSNKKYEGWTAELWTDDAVRFIAEKKDRPWLLAMAYIIPHTPWKPADERFAPYYRAKGCSENIAACYSHIEQMDGCVGRLLDALRETGQERRTLVIYVSDNGQTGPAAKTVNKEGHIQSEDWAARNVAGLRGCKSLVWENGIRVPLMKVQDVAGKMHVGRGLKGFATGSDRAVYKLDVVKSGDYRIRLTGSGLEHAAHLSIQVAGQTLTAHETADKSIEFGAATLPTGEMELEIVGGKPDGKMQPVSIERILFSFEK